MNKAVNARNPEPTAEPRESSPPAMDEHLVTLLDPASFEAEQYRGLRHALEQMHKPGGLTVVAVSSPTVGEGKTTTASNLAAALAEAPDARVLLGDADLRRSSLAAYLGLGDPVGPGLVEAILDPSLALEAVVRRGPSPNLWVLPAGTRRASPYDVLGSPRVGELLEEARQRYDFVVLDTPPLVPVPDCRVLAKWIDGLLVVVAAHRTPRRLVEEALSLVDPGKIVGLVFNGDDRPLAECRGSYYACDRGLDNRRRWWGGRVTRDRRPSGRRRSSGSA